MFPKWSDWNIQYTTKGLIKHRISRMIRTFILAATIVGAYYIRKDVRGGLRTFLSLIRQNSIAGLLNVLNTLQRGIGRLAR